MLQHLAQTSDELLYQTSLSPDPAVETAAAGVSAVVFILYIAVAVLIFASMWKVFTKAGKPGWAALVPFYNIVVLLRIVGKPVWWLVLYFIPFVSLIPAIIVSHELSKKFGFGVGMTLLQIFLPFIAYPVLGFGSAQYQSGEAAPVTPVPQAPQNSDFGAPQPPVQL